VTFGHLQRASSAARLIGEWADQALEVLAEARLTAEQALPDGQRYVLFIWVCFFYSHICSVDVQDE
jgi:hypothetical protein